MIGFPDKGVIEAAGQLQKLGLIRYRRGHITVLDRAGLERLCCECYHVVKDEADRLTAKQDRLIAVTGPAHTAA